MCHIYLTLFYHCIAQRKLDINETIKVVLESDGTEIDEDDYFDTLEKNTLIMILKPNEKWCSYSDIRYSIERFLVAFYIVYTALLSCVVVLASSTQTIK